MQIIALNRCWTIRVWLLLILIVVLTALIALSVWQLQRANTKTKLQQHLSMLEQQGEVSLANWQTLAPESADGIRVKHPGRWLAPYVWLLDNQMLNHRIGYDIIVPVRLYGSSHAVLVNLGWIAAPTDRAHLPQFAVPETIQIGGRKVHRPHFTDQRHRDVPSKIDIIVAA